MRLTETATQNVGLLLHPESESTADTQAFSIDKTTKAERDCSAETPYPFKLNVSFEAYRESGMAVNEAEIYLRAEDYIRFVTALIGHEILLPTNYRQWKEDRADGVCIHIEATEPPGRFIARLTAIMREIKS